MLSKMSFALREIRPALGPVIRLRVRVVHAVVILADLLVGVVTMLVDAGPPVCMAGLVALFISGIRNNTAQVPALLTSGAVAMKSIRFGGPGDCFSLLGVPVTHFCPGL